MTEFVVSRGILLRVHLFLDISLCRYVNMNSYIPCIQRGMVTIVYGVSNIFFIVQFV